VQHQEIDHDRIDNRSNCFPYIIQNSEALDDTVKKYSSANQANKAIKIQKIKLTIHI
jgi:hypothetical protein